MASSVRVVAPSAPAWAKSASHSRRTAPLRVVAPSAPAWAKSASHSRRTAPQACAAASAAAQGSLEQGVRFDYAGVLSQRAAGGCPGLFLAPMENLGERRFRTALCGEVGGFDEACTEFIRIPDKPGNVLKASIGLVRDYDALELGSMPLGCQLMGGVPEVMGHIASLVARPRDDRGMFGAPRVDINCGCPANCVTGKGAGSSLLKTPDLLHEVVSAMVAGAERSAQEHGGPVVPVSVKMRAGFDDRSLMRDNLAAAEAAGAAFVTLHPRTKREGYHGAADWSNIREAKELLRIPVIGNGDVTTPERALRLVEETNCDGIMIGRGAVMDPLIFHRVRAAFAAQGCASPAPPLLLEGPEHEAALLAAFLRNFYYTKLDTEQHAGIKKGRKKKAGPGSAGYERRRIDKLKQLARYLFSRNELLRKEMEVIKRVTEKDGSAEEFLERLVGCLEAKWGAGAVLDTPVNTFPTRKGDHAAPATPAAGSGA